MALLLRLPDNLSNAPTRRRFLEQAAARLPFYGKPIDVEFAPSLTTYRGKLLVSSSLGTSVYAATFLRSRKVILEEQLLDDRQMLLFFLIHELFHFVWMRLGNGKRAEFAALISAEIRAKGRGEIAESSEVAKARWLERRDSSRIWRDYVCESFCDTGASILSANGTSSLGAKWLRQRQRWLEATRPGEGWRC